MLQENEIVMAILGFGTLIFISSNRHQLQRLPSSRILLSGFYVLAAGWLMTILEEFFLGDLLNLLEHIFYAASSILMVIWCWQVLHKKRQVS